MSSTLTSPTTATATTSKTMKLSTTDGSNSKSTPTNRRPHKQLSDEEIIQRADSFLSPKKVKDDFDRELIVRNIRKVEQRLQKLAVNNPEYTFLQNKIQSYQQRLQQDTEQEDTVLINASVSMRKIDENDDDGNANPNKNELQDSLVDSTITLPSSLPLEVEHQAQVEELPQQDDVFCKVFHEEEQIGFIQLTTTSTFDDARTVITEELDDEIPDSWKFMILNLGPVALKQEPSMIVYKLYKGTATNREIGTVQNPISLLVKESA